MAIDEVAAYTEALAEFVVAGSRVEALVGRLPPGAFPGWRSTRFSNTGVMFPSGTTDRLVHAQTWTYEELVPARDLDQALADWHSRLFRMHVAWNRLSANQQSSLQEPPAPME